MQLSGLPCATRGFTSGSGGLFLLNPDCLNVTATAQRGLIPLVLYRSRAGSAPR